MKTITLKTIPHKEQRYETVGDYYVDGDGETFVVSDMGNDDYEFLVLIHELVEAHLCKKRGVDWRAIDAFDIEFEKNRTAGDVSEPGDDPLSPYQNEHNFATAVERMVCAALGVKWKDYEEAVLRLSK